jgi:hypothetical protein
MRHGVEKEIFLYEGVSFTSYNKSITYHNLDISHFSTRYYIMSRVTLSSMFFCMHVALGQPPLQKITTLLLEILHHQHPSSMLRLFIYFSK